MDKKIIILLETATDSCSAALADGEKIVAEKYANVPKAHATLLARFVDEILKENKLTAADCAAVAVSEGPGSYTGLRVGASLAKGLCYGANLPLIGVSTLAAIAQCAMDNQQLHKAMQGRAAIISSSADYLIVPMIDAGRMEVYTAVFNSAGEQLTKTESKILTPDSFSKELQGHPVLFTGNGAEKFQKMLKAANESSPVVNFKNAFFSEQLPHATGLRIQAFKALQAQDFKDRAYFQPSYLKDFIPGKPKKLL
ncbi:MAG: tRNA (adenosine(37)-N6)-threonylcarbamoyltransferase complex dimerization subunit type 1 TsaB [Bacteroidales bacterium]|jgi:tRNA threonylcarbamoyladenosine biosynthesis protein TsaB|nr:tRNA (adenosine(37)-N6)-threonylcarbamoyltransferase complex dimerization subunit type 1 TsaB [Bacteroidales bacterium]MCI1733847.1 tRNA (adenosine(37)-N6)-threonylcarbamoyltransferase complex dimerization subunit type 1 TsaB [Bacteroidales bacterium]